MVFLMYMYILGLVFGIFAGLITVAFSFRLHQVIRLRCFVYMIQAQPAELPCGFDSHPRQLFFFEK